MRGAASALVLALLLAGCAQTPLDTLLPEAEEGDGVASPDTAPDAATPPDATVTEAGETPETGTAPEAGTAPDRDAPTDLATALGPAADAPHIYMALQPDAAGPISVVLAIDRSRDGTPSDDPAIRITPADGQCNPEQLRRHDFPPGPARRPAYGPDEAASGVTARELPDFMATAVTSEMVAAGLADGPEEAQPQSVCTRKLLQRMIIDRSAAAG